MRLVTKLRTDGHNILIERGRPPQISGKSYPKQLKAKNIKVQ